MKYAGWIAGVIIISSFIAACEIIIHIKGSDLVVELASLCVFIVWGMIVWQVGKWADKEIQMNKNKNNAK